jgi:hypothetical protein
VTFTWPVALLAVACAVTSPSLGAQPAEPVRVGDRTRLLVRGEKDPLVGRLAARQGDTLVVDADLGVTERLLAPSLERIERSGGRSAGLGARRGARWGAITVGGLMLLGGSHGMRGGEVVATVGLYTAIGAVIGASRRPERWVVATVPVTPSPAVAGGTAPATARRDSVVGERLGGPARQVPPGGSFPHTLRVLMPGDRVRFRSGSPHRVVGRVIAASEDSLWLDRGGAPTRYPVAALRDVERHDGRTARAGMLRAMKFGAVPGFVLGGLLGVMLANWDERASAGQSVGAMLFVGGVGAATGAALAAPIGAALPADDWRRVELPPRSRGQSRCLVFVA